MTKQQLTEHYEGKLLSANLRIAGYQISIRQLEDEVESLKVDLHSPFAKFLRGLKLFIAFQIGVAFGSILILIAFL